MPYELDLLTRLVTGDLAPTSFYLTDQATYHDFLRQRFGHCARHFKVQYERPAAGKLAYQYHDEFAFLELRDLPRLTPAPDDTGRPLLGLLLDDALARFQLTLARVQEVSYRQVGPQLFLEITTSEDITSLPAAKARYFYYHTHLLDEAARLRRALPKRALAQPDAPTLARFVQHYQRLLQQLLTHTQQQLAAPPPLGAPTPVRAYPVAAIHQLVATELENLLAYLEQTFPDSLDLRAPLTPRRRVQALADVQLPLQAVLAALHAAPALPDPLKTLVLDCLHRLQLSSSPEVTLSYQDVLYPRLLLRELHGRLQRGWPLTADNLASLLLRYNFNALDFRNLVTAHIRAQATATGDHLADQLPVVLRYLKLYRQLQPATKLCYVPALPPLRTQLIQWLKRERDYLRHLLQTLAAPPPIAGSPVEAARLLTPLSVAQLAQLFRALHEAGVFGDTSHREVFRLLAANFRTARQAQISEKSLADKFYNAEESTQQAVQKIIHQMLDHFQQIAPALLTGFLASGMKLLENLENMVDLPVSLG